MTANENGRIKRQPRPFFNRNRQCWYVQLGKKQVKLGPDEAQAFAAYFKLMADRNPITAEISANGVIEHFLEHTKMTRAARTYDIYSEYLVRFSRYLNSDFPNLRAADLRSIHVTKFRYSLADKTYSHNTLHSIISND